MPRRRALSFALVLVLATAGCTADRPAADRTRTGGPPAGGWPQAADGKLTEKMCGLLTGADYQKYGHAVLDEPTGEASINAMNAVSCTHVTGEEMTLYLQPSAQAATLLFDKQLADQQAWIATKKTESQLVQDVVSGAEQSFFDVSRLTTLTAKAYELHARRGALLVTLELAGFSGPLTDPKGMLTALASTVLERVPDLGRTDPGKTLKVRYEVTGNGRAASISYVEPTSGKERNLSDVPLPWSVEVPIASLGRNPQPVQLNAQAQAPQALVGCAISANGKEITQQTLRRFTALCSGSYVETDA